MDQASIINDRGNMPEKSYKGDKCPLINEPLPGCYCNFSSSQYVDKLLYYCGGRFLECEIYINADENTKADSNG